MKTLLFPAAIAAVLVLAVVGCGQQTTEVMPPPHELTQNAVGHYCGMNLMEHVGPKGQIILASRSEPVWFSSARDAFSFTMLPEEAKDIRAIYVSDMAKAPDWEEPGTTNWVEARKAVFVIESRMTGGMGAPETVPFSDRAAAETFVAENGGRVVAFADMPRDYVLGTEATKAPEPAAEPGTGGHGH
jgi:copper chaperone NosL